MKKIRIPLFAAFCLVTLTLLAYASAFGAPAPADAANAGHLTVMTRNIYFGIDPTALLTGDCEDFPVAATAAYQEALQSDFPARAEAIAAEIVQTMPDLVGIQEAVIWSELFVGGKTVDFVGLIRAELAAAGADYAVVALASGLDIAFPTTLGGPVRLQVNDVLLAREASALALSNVQTGTYQIALTGPTCLGQVSIPRQWAAADVEVGGETVRVITTHLESAISFIRTAQATELVAGPAAGTLPTIVMGDLNAEPGTANDAAAIVLAAGFADTWPSATAGDTCCQASDLRNATSLLDKRIDLVLTRGDFQVTAATRVGETPLSPPPASGVLWASDHAGVVTALTIAEEPMPAIFLPLLRRSPAEA